MGDFELTMRLFFGDRARHLEESAMPPKDRNKWLRSAFKRITKDFGQLDSSPEHRDSLLLEAGYLNTSGLPGFEGAGPTWGLVYSLLRIIGYLLGYGLCEGRKFYTAVWWQDRGQYYVSKALRGKGWFEFSRDHRTAVARRAEIAEKLRNDGLDDFQISLVLNTTDYEVKKLRRLKQRKQND